MHRVRVAVALLLFGPVLASWGCASRRSAPVREPSPVTSAERIQPEVPEPSATASLTPEALQPAFFALDSHDLSSTARSALDHNAKVLIGHPQLAVTIEGHCDERGTVEYNLALGERRARAARDYLVLSGIDASRMAVLSFGEERPFEVGAHESAWSQNRRAEFVVP